MRGILRGILLLNSEFVLIDILSSMSEHTLSCLSCPKLCHQRAPGRLQADSAVLCSLELMSSSKARFPQSNIKIWLPTLIGGKTT